MEGEEVVCGRGRRGGMWKGKEHGMWKGEEGM